LKESLKKLLSSQTFQKSPNSSSIKRQSIEKREKKKHRKKQKGRKAPKVSLF
jgi:hypothetical protein